MIANPGTFCSNGVTASRLPVRFCSLRRIIGWLSGSASAAAFFSITNSRTFAARKLASSAGSVRSSTWLGRPRR